MTTSKIYKTMIGARLAILMGRIKSFFKGGHYVAETFTLKYSKADKTYELVHYTMTHDEKRLFDEAIAIKQQEIVEVAQKEYVDATTEAAPKMDAKPKQKAKPKVKKMDTNIDTENILTDIKNRGVYSGEAKPKTKKKYYYNNNKKKKAGNDNSKPDSNQ
jgi:hypothetical protein